MNYYLLGRRYRIFVNFRYIQHIPEFFEDILYEYILYEYIFRKQLNENYKELKVVF